MDGMIIAVLNLKGGVGKTTTALALATVAQRQYWDVRVYDADEQGSACLWADTAAEAGEPLPFNVDPINATRIARLKAGNCQAVFIDCPPTGKTLDAAKDVADLIVVPMTPAGLDIQQTWVVADTLERANRMYAILLTHVRPNTIALQVAEEAIAKRGASIFETGIPLREDIKNSFGHPFGSDMFGYDKVFKEITEAMD